MKLSMASLVHVEPKRLWSAALLVCLLVPLLFLSALRLSSQPLSILAWQVSIVHNDDSAPLAGEDEGGPRRPARDGDDAALLSENNIISRSAGEGEELTRAAEDGSGGIAWNRDETRPSVRHTDSYEKTSDEEGTLPVDGTRSSPSSTGGDEAPSSSKDVGSSQDPEDAAKESRIICDFLQIRTDFCNLYGDVRINGSSSSVLLAIPFPPATPAGNDTWRIRPYARKWETALMPYITEFSITTSLRGDEGSPRCTINHSVPAVIFSSGGFMGNFFHDMNDVLIPLFLTSRKYNGEVQFLVTQYNPGWVDKYQPILRRLSNYEVIDADADSGVHCFPQATVGLRSHAELGIDPSKPPAGYSMADFRQFLRSCYSLKREYSQCGEANRKPRLLLLSRRGSRALLNEGDVVRMARSLGFKVAVATPESTRNQSRFARTVNSCDVLLGVHGAGLTNMVFLPTDATVIQVIPFGDLKHGCRFTFGDPAVGMGLRYLDYEVGKEESSLMEQYPKDHPVLTDPLSIHKQGFMALWSIYINKQNITVDVGRFRTVLLEASQP